MMEICSTLLNFIMNKTFKINGFRIVRGISIARWQS